MGKNNSVFNFSKIHGVDKDIIKLAYYFEGDKQVDIFVYGTMHKGFRLQPYYKDKHICGIERKLPDLNDNLELERTVNLIIDDIHASDFVKIK
jgi:hypothetical protein